MKAKDNTAAEHHRLRSRVLRECAAPMVLETHGGWGRAYERIWYKAAGGWVLEKDETKAAHLARQRPRWAVYEADSTAALASGLARAQAFEIVDVGYTSGACIPVLDALMTVDRRFPDVWHLVVNDSGRATAKPGKALAAERLAGVLRVRGGDLAGAWLEILRECAGELASSIGFALSHFEGYYTGEQQGITHFWARFTREEGKL